MRNTKNDASYDARNIKNGSKIPVEYYSDQPYVVKADDGAWVLVVTTGAGMEGDAGQHVISMRSTDCGKTWTDVTDVESASSPESSYAVLYKTSSGRIYCFYNFNADNTRSILADDPPFENGVTTRVDTQGHFVFKFSDDCGRSWSKNWYDIPLENYQVDLENPYGGKIKFFWNVGKPFSYNGGGFVPQYKVGKFGEGFMYHSEGTLLFCQNIETETNPEKLTWETFPKGGRGIRTDRTVSNISEEHSFVVLSDNSIFCTFRTVTGHPYCAYSRDGGVSFSEPEPLTYDNGRQVKHPRAANFIWKCENGKYLYWYHNNGCRWYEERNPAWLCGAVEADSPQGKILRFSQPEIILYDHDINIRISYPDLIEANGEYYITETQKRYACVHRIDKALIEGLWAQLEGAKPTVVPFKPLKNGAELPYLQPFTVKDFEAEIDCRSKLINCGLTLDFDITGENGVLISNAENEKGLFIEQRDGQLIFSIGDGKFWCTKTTGETALSRGAHHVTVIIDGGPRIVMFLIDGVLYDGGNEQMFGFGWFNLHLGDINGANNIKISDSAKNVKICYKAITVSEAIALA